MVGGRVGPALRKQAGNGDGKLAPVGEEDGKVVQPGDAGVAPPAFDLGQPQQVAPVHAQASLGRILPVHLQAEELLVEVELVRQVGDFERHIARQCLRVDALGGDSDGLGDLDLSYLK